MSKVETLRELLRDLRDDVPHAEDAQALYRVVTPVMEAIEKLPPSERAELRHELGAVIAAFESRILALEMRLKDARSS